MLHTKFVEKIKTLFCNGLLNRDVYEIMWEKIVERGRPQMTIWRMGISSLGT